MTRRALIGVLVAMTMTTGVAHAAPGQIVASANGFDLYARHGAHGGVCLAVLGPSDASGDSQCQRVFSAFQPAMTYTFRPRVPIGVAVPATVARIGVGEQSVDTIAVDGFSVRFALITGAGRSPLLRSFDAGGALVGAARSEFGGLEGGGTTVFQAPGVRVRVRRSFDLEPSPLDFDRTVPTTCLTLRGQNGGTSGCTRDSALKDFDVELLSTCAPARPLLYGLVADRVRSVALVFGDGRTRTFATRALTAGLGPGRIVAVSLPRGLAVHSARGLDGDGQTTGRKVLGAAPSGLPCPDDNESSAGFAISYASDLFSGGLKPIAAPVLVAPTDGGALRAADGPGATLCSGIRRRLSCAVPPVDATRAFVDRRGGLVGSVLSADVASVSLVLRDGATVEAATTDGPAYTGRYAGRVRFLATTLPAGAVVTRAVPRDTGGHRVGTLYVGAADPVETSTRRPFAPGVSLVSSTIDTGEGAQPYVCLQPRHPRSAIANIGVCTSPRRFATGALVSVTCAPRRAVVFGTLRGHRIRLQLSGGETLRPAVRGVKGLGRVWTAVLPRDRGLVSFRTGGRTRPLPVPPANEQCGYEDVSTALR